MSGAHEVASDKNRGFDEGQVNVECGKWNMEAHIDTTPAVIFELIFESSIIFERSSSMFPYFSKS